MYIQVSMETVSISVILWMEVIFDMILFGSSFLHKGKKNPKEIQLDSGWHSFAHSNLSCIWHLWKTSSSALSWVSSTAPWWYQREGCSLDLLKIIKFKTVMIKVKTERKILKVLTVRILSVLCGQSSVEIALGTLFVALNILPSLPLPFF